MMTKAQDVATWLSQGGEGFGQLAAILKTIENEAGNDRHLRALAGAGLHIAENMAEMSRCWHDDVCERGVS